MSEFDLICPLNQAELSEYMKIIIAEAKHEGAREAIEKLWKEIRPESTELDYTAAKLSGNNYDVIRAYEGVGIILKELYAQADGDPALLGSGQAELGKEKGEKPCQS